MEFNYTPIKTIQEKTRERRGGIEKNSSPKKTCIPESKFFIKSFGARKKMDTNAQ